LFEIRREQFEVALFPLQKTFCQTRMLVETIASVRINSGERRTRKIAHPTTR